jgi:hypothetical protein
LTIFDQDSSFEATTPIVIAFKICTRHRKNGVLNRLFSEVRFYVFD